MNPNKPIIPIFPMNLHAATESVRSYVAGSEGQMTSTFNVRLPEISQVEVTNACNFTCDFCPRDQPGVSRPDTFIDLDLVKLIALRDLGGSHFVEFQLSGEPTLHRQLPQIIEQFQGKVLTGLSTNGSSMRANRVWQGLLMLDYLTISVDSVEKYEEVRPGGKWTRLLENIDFLMQRRGANTFPAVDLQLIEFPGVERQRDLLLKIVEEHGWDVTVRRVPDCFLSVTREMKKVRKTDLCLNPFMSVSVQSDGDVVPCCYAFGKQVVYGNLKKQSLEEIWNTSPTAKRFRELHLMAQTDKSTIGVPFCDDCYQRSPVMLHWDLYTSTVRKQLIERNQMEREKTKALWEDTAETSPAPLKE